MKYLKVYLDDERLPEDPSWTLVRWPGEAIELLKTNRVIALSVDHDLSKDMPDGPDDKCYGTGYEILLWIEENAALNGFIPPEEIILHSANPAARIRMEQAVGKIKELYENNMKNKLRMEFEEHCEESIRLFGKPYVEVHKFLDQYAGLPGIGLRHRRKLHHQAGIEEVVRQFGEEAREVAKAHIISDLKLDGWTNEYPFPQNEADYIMTGFY